MSALTDAAAPRVGRSPAERAHADRTEQGPEHRRAPRKTQELPTCGRFGRFQQGSPLRFVQRGGLFARQFHAEAHGVDLDEL